MQYACVLGKTGKTLMPCHPARARQLLKKGKAVVVRRYPFVIRLTQQTDGNTQPLELKVDSGSKTTGMAIVRHGLFGAMAVMGINLTHRGKQISELLTKRRAVRQSRRARKTRYRQARFLNRVKSKKAGWLAPSVQSRIDNVVEWVKRLIRWMPVSHIGYELVRFDTQAMQNPDISGIEYQQGTLQGYEVKEYLLAKFHHQCVYCDAKEVPLQIDHVMPRSKGGSNRVSNLVLACRACNQAKGNLPVEQFVKDSKRLNRIQAQVKAPLKDASVVNSIRWALLNKLKGFGLPVLTGTGGQTKFNRTQQGYTKDHWIDAVCCTDSGENVKIPHKLKPMTVTKQKRSTRQMCRMDKYGFPCTTAKSAKTVKGFRTGDMVKAIVTKGKKAGIYVGKVAVRAKGSFNITTKSATIQGISYKDCTAIHRFDGYSYA